MNTVVQLGTQHVLFDLFSLFSMELNEESNQISYRSYSENIKMSFKIILTIESVGDLEVSFHNNFRKHCFLCVSLAHGGKISGGNVWLPFTSTSRFNTNKWIKKNLLKTISVYSHHRVSGSLYLSQA